MRIELTNTNEEEEHGQHQTARPERSGNGAIVIQHSRLARPRPVSLSSRFNHPQSAHFPSVPYSRARRMHHSRIAIAHRAQLLPIHLRKPEPPFLGDVRRPRGSDEEHQRHLRRSEEEGDPGEDEAEGDTQAVQKAGAAARIRSGSSGAGGPLGGSRRGRSRFVGLRVWSCAARVTPTPAGGGGR
jgi:hypothetical protein